MTITKINKARVVDQIQVGDQLIGVDDDYFPYFPTRDLVQFIKNNRSNPVCILTLQRYKKDKIWELVRLIPTAQEQIPCHGKNCLKNAAVSWASNTNPNCIRDFCEGCQVVEFGGWPNGVVPIKTSAGSNGGDNTHVDSQVEPPVAIAPGAIYHDESTLAMLKDAIPLPPPTTPLPTTLPPIVDNTQLEPLVVSQVDGGDTQVESVSPPDIEDPVPILLRNVDCYVSGLLASFPRKTLNKMVHEVLILYP